jgi:hypothetical protein
VWNKGNDHWWVFKLASAKWISVWPLENRWSILDHQAGGAIQTIEQGVSDSPEKACSESLEKAKTKGYLLPVAGRNE